jgi:hypothetical protein
MKIKSFKDILAENNQNSTSIQRTPGIIFDEISGGFGHLYLAIEKYIHLFEQSETKGKRLHESEDGNALKETIAYWTKYISERIAEIKPRAREEFNTSESQKRTRNINRYSYNINDILEENSNITNNSNVNFVERKQVYQKCQEYINLIPELNKIIEKHNNYFLSLEFPQNDQVIELVWSDFK